MSKAPKPAGMAEFSFLPGLVPQPMEPSASAGAEGHRLRMRQRLLKAGPESLADHEMLEMILFIALPRRDTKPIARELLTRFRTFGGVVGAPANELMAIEGIGEAGAAALKLVQAAALRMMRKELATQPVLSTWDRLTDYLTVSMEHERTEHFRILFLDRPKQAARGRGSGAWDDQPCAGLSARGGAALPGTARQRGDPGA